MHQQFWAHRWKGWLTISWRSKWTTTYQQALHDALLVSKVTINSRLNWIYPCNTANNLIQFWQHYLPPYRRKVKSQIHQKLNVLIKSADLFNLCKQLEQFSFANSLSLHSIYLKPLFCSQPSRKASNNVPCELCLPLWIFCK